MRKATFIMMQPDSSQVSFYSLWLKFASLTLEVLVLTNLAKWLICFVPQGWAVVNPGFWLCSQEGSWCPRRWAASIPGFLERAGVGGQSPPNGPWKSFPAVVWPASWGSTGGTKGTRIWLPSAPLSLSPEPRTGQGNSCLLPLGVCTLFFKFK